ncbi:fimbrial biogenesis outer membrane usher protein [Pseudomonas sp. 1912-s]|uniref:fimbria/pilus outer membrane usher protein n=1 Tax=Pseudomonas sp. 1912-s TaxID=3033802 RepID=UPI0023DF07F4|nr:fimbria/pilus outer membrane usher protein [Pseudomonas sp. 1912-s]MDF3199163.1 fimbrial biogenesis outer membrane usher protein [Pseudomonas sp. 1912-s]
MKLRGITGAWLGIFLIALPKVEAATQFDTDFVAGFDGANGEQSDLQTMLQEQELGSGRYLVNVQLNQEFLGQREISFVEKGDKLNACMPSEMLEGMGIRLPTIAGDASCPNLSELLEGAAVHFNSRQLKLDISVPQIYLKRDVLGYVKPEVWDEGVNAGFLNYQFSGSQNQHQDQRTNQYNLYLNGGLNLGTWRLRSSSSYRKDGTWERAASYVQRDLSGTAGQLVIGESITPGDTLQSIPFRGVQLASDMDMLPDSLQGYAPVIRGVARTQAKVEVRQHGYSLYSTFVPPGAFEIRDLNAASGSGDLEVIITEADGTEQRFIQPYATLGNLLRQGIWRYNVTVGQYHSPSTPDEQPNFLFGSYARGLANDYTMSLAGLVAEDYSAYQVGVGKGLGNLGAISLDVTQAQSTVSAGSIKGQSYGLRYGKMFTTGTNLRFAGYRYSTPGYRDFSEVVNERSWQRGLSIDGNYQPASRRSRLEASLSQSLSGGTSMYLNLSQQDYWNTNRLQRQLQFGLSGQVGQSNVSLYASKSLSDDDREGLQVGLTLSFAMGSQNARVSMERNAYGTHDQHIGLSGIAGPYSDLNYNLDLQRSEVSSNTGSASVNYRAPWADLNAGFSSSSDYSSENIGISGSILAHAGGVQLSQHLGETMALVEVKDTPNVGLLNAPGVLTDSKGYSLVPYVQPYRRNRLSLDTRELDADTDIDNGVSTVVPRRGSVVLAKFKAHRSEKVLATVSFSGGGVVPFGAAVLNGAGQRVSAVGPMGQVLLSVSEDRHFHLVWGHAANQQCRFTLDLEQTRKQEGFTLANVYCVAG